MSATATYRAARDCMAAGIYRRAGEIFTMPELDIAPPHLELLEGRALAAATSVKVRLPRGGKRAAVTAKNAATSEDVGGAKARSVSEISSADMIKE